ATLVVTTDAGKRRVPVKTLRQVVILGEAGLTTSVLNLLGRAGVRVTVLDWHGNVTGSYEPAGSPAAGRIRLAQARAVLDPAARPPPAEQPGELSDLLVQWPRLQRGTHRDREIPSRRLPVLPALPARGTRLAGARPRRGVQAGHLRHADLRDLRPRD